VVVVHFADIGGIVDHSGLNLLCQLLWRYQAWHCCGVTKHDIVVALPNMTLLSAPTLINNIISTSFHI